MAATIEDVSFEIKAKSCRRKPMSKNTTAERFWLDFDLICDITQLKSEIQNGEQPEFLNG